MLDLMRPVILPVGWRKRYTWWVLCIQGRIKILSMSGGNRFGGPSVLHGPFDNQRVALHWTLRVLLDRPGL